MARPFRLLLVGLALAAAAAGCKKDIPATAPATLGPPQGAKQSPKWVPLPR
jgi:hypothetical protein